MQKAQAKQLVNMKLAIIFWLSLGTIMFASLINFITLGDLLVKILFGGLFLIPLVYFNYLYLIPHYLEKQKYLHYGIFSVLLILISTYFRFLLDINYSENPSFFLGEMSEESVHKRVFFVMLLLHIGFYLLSISYHIALKWNQNKRILVETKNQHLEAELKFLRLQLNPHFLFNTLNNIYTLSYLKSDKAAPMIMKLSQSMRYMVHECNSERVSLKKEVLFLQNYISLATLKDSQIDTIDFEIKGLKTHHQIAPLLLLSFFENIFKHGDFAINSTAWAKIRLELSQDDKLELEIENTKSTSQNLNKNIEKSGLGLENVQKRLNLLYPKNHQLIIEDRETFKILLKITLK